MKNNQMPEGFLSAGIALAFALGAAVVAVAVFLE